jgi:hypothetical protein
MGLTGGFMELQVARWTTRRAWATFLSSMPRLLQPELLDALPPDHPDARHSRRDLRLINLLMGNHRWLARTVAAVVRTDERILELGAGDGTLTRRLAAAGRLVDALDLAPPPSDWPAGMAWHSADLVRFGGYARYGAVVGNLIFHHFSAEALAALGRALGTSVRVVLACEPVRRKSSRRLFALLAPLFRANRVTRHDARVSIDAGFDGDELPELLGLDPAEWRWHCRTTRRGAYQMVAIRQPRP